jgi:SSS family solute:Na+ symporter
VLRFELSAELLSPIKSPLMDALAVSSISELSRFHAIDWVIVACYLSVSLIIGILVTRYATSMTAYIGAGRSVGPWLGVATMTGTEMGLITVMYMAQSGFTGGFAAFHMALIAGLGTLLVGLTGFIVVPLRKLRVLTIPEFYERRFGPEVRVLGGIILAGAGILNMGLFLQVGAQFIVGATGLELGGSTLIAVMTGLLVLVLVYTVLGGMISVILTDYTQFVVLSVGVVITSVLAIRKIGADEMYVAVRDSMGEAGFDPTADGSTFGLSYVLYQFFAAGIVGCAVWPTAVSRSLAMESPAAVKKQLSISAVSFVMRFLIPMFWGIAAFTWFSRIHPELSATFIGDSKIDDAGLYALPVFLSQILPTGILGLVVAAMIAAFMSTHDSYLLCWSSVLTQDVVAPLSKKNLSNRSRILLTRIFIVLIGAFIWGWGLFYKGSDRIWDYMVITGSIYFTGAFVVMVGGLYWKGASQTGAIAGLLAGASAVLGLEPIRVSWVTFVCRIFALDSEQWLTEITSSVVGLCSLGLTAVLFVVVSLMTPDESHEYGGGTADD